MLEELLWFHNEKKITLQCVARKEGEAWPGLKGQVTSTLVSNCLPPPLEESLVMVCGSWDFKCNKLLSTRRSSRSSVETSGIH